MNIEVVPLDQLSADAHELAGYLASGFGEPMDVIYGGSYAEPAQKAALLRATAQVLDGIQ